MLGVLQQNVLFAVLLGGVLAFDRDLIALRGQDVSCRRTAE